MDYKADELVKKKAYMNRLEPEDLFAVFKRQLHPEGVICSILYFGLFCEEIHV